MAEVLTPQQMEAVRNRGGKLLVSAAAGSGKTKVLVDRLLSYICDPSDPANIDDFLIITFTEAAAAELRGKIAAKLSEKIAAEPGNRHLQQQVQRMYLTQISTVHAFCANILREHAYLLDIPADFRVADEREGTEIQTQAIDLVLNEAYLHLEENEDFYSFVNSQGFGRDDSQVPEILLKVYNSARCHLDPEKWLDWCISCAETEGITDASETVWGKYLLNDLKGYIALQIDALNKCIDATAFVDGMDKPAALLSSITAQLRYLSEAETWDETVKRKNIDFGRLTFSKKCTDLQLNEQIKAVRNACKDGMAQKLRSFASESAQILLDLNTSASAARGLICLVRAFSAEYERRKRIRRILDFSDLEHLMLDLLIGRKRSGPTALAAEIGARYREVMVDEYQDTNSVQDAIFNALTVKRQNCFMVGDVKQSIYQFRLADPTIFLQKYNTYAFPDMASPMEGRKILLSSNFRSSNGVIQCVNDVFRYCMSPEVGGLQYGEDEMLREGIPHIPLSDPEITLYGIDVKEDTYNEEAAFVAQKIKSLLDGKHLIRQADELRPVEPEDIVILLRSPNSVGNNFVLALEQLGIPCTTGKSVDLLQTEEITALRSLLQVIDNPLQDIPLIATMVSRCFGFTANDLAAIRSNHRWCNMYEALLAQTDEKCRKFISLLNTLRQDARLYTLSQLLQRIFVHTAMDTIYATSADGIEKKQNLLSFVQLAADFEAAGHRDLNQFLIYLEALDEKGLTSTAEQQGQGTVNILSIHKSKGLEFPIVFLCGLSRRFNHESAYDQVLCDKELGLGLCCVDTKNRVRYPTIAKRAISSKIIHDGVSEEMRVLYVAMTRARDRLIMTYAAQNIASDLADVALRIDMTDSRLMTEQVSCPGEWILQSAMQRTEAGAFFQLAGHPNCVQFKEPVWDIQIVEVTPEASETAKQPINVSKLPDRLIEDLQKSLNYTYPYQLATQAPSKQTATQLKGRIKDLEVVSDTKEDPFIYHRFRKPAFIEETTDGRSRGNAVHAVLQYINFSACTDINSIENEIHRLVSERLISLEQSTMVSSEKLFKLFASEIGKCLTCTNNILREFKFSILDDSNKYIPGLENEQILLQGVVDCALIEPEGITIIDFKTDHATDASISKIIDRYALQVNIYARAMERIYQQKVIAKYLYLFDLDRFVPIP